MTPCPTGKRSYPSPRVGREANFRNGKRLRFYPCQDGGPLHWHATNQAAEGRAVTIAPDRWRGGTNLMAWRPIDALTVQYGVGSFERHCAAARAAGASLSICELEGASIDVDEPADVQAIIEAARSSLAPRTREFFRAANLPGRLPAAPKRTA